MTKRKLFCEISPLTYRISKKKSIVSRIFEDFFSDINFSHAKSESPLPILIYSHNSLIRRRLGNEDMVLQENKAVNLAIAAPKVNGIIIRPNETFSFWKLVGSDSEKKGYKDGLTITSVH